MKKKKKDRKEQKEKREKESLLLTDTDETRDQEREMNEEMQGAQIMTEEKKTLETERITEPDMMTKEETAEADKEASSESEQAAPQPAVEDYQALARKMEELEAESSQMKEELEKLKNHRKHMWRRRLYQGFLKSVVPGLRDLMELYLEYEGKETRFEEISGWMRGNLEQMPAIRAELAADRERYCRENCTDLAISAGILSVAGLVCSVAGVGGSGLVVLFLILVLVAAGVTWKSLKDTECRRFMEYIRGVSQEMGETGKSKKL